MHDDGLSDLNLMPVKAQPIDHTFVHLNGLLPLQIGESSNNGGLHEVHARGGEVGHRRLCIHFMQASRDLTCMGRKCEG
jgi:hypothetical protein